MLEFSITVTYKSFKVSLKTNQTKMDELILEHKITDF